MPRVLEFCNSIRLHLVFQWPFWPLWMQGSNFRHCLNYYVTPIKADKTVISTFNFRCSKSQCFSTTIKKVLRNSKAISKRLWPLLSDQFYKCIGINTAQAYLGKPIADWNLNSLPSIIADCFSSGSLITSHFLNFKTNSLIIKHKSAWALDQLLFLFYIL